MPLKKMNIRLSQLKLYNQLKVLEALCRILFSQQRVFEYRDNPGKQLARLLAETDDRSFGVKKRKEDSLWAVTPQEKLSIFF